MRGSSLMAAARAGSFTLSDIAPTRFLEAMRRVLPAAVQMSEVQVAERAMAADAMETVYIVRVAFFVCLHACLSVLVLTMIWRFLTRVV